MLSYYEQIINAIFYSNEAVLEYSLLNWPVGPVTTVHWAFE